MNDPNTHGVVIPLAEGSVAFIDGVPDKCEHDYTGDSVLFTQSGKIIYWYTYRKWASFTTPIREEFIIDHQNKIKDPVCGGAVTCRKCKKIFSPPLF